MVVVYWLVVYSAFGLFVVVFTWRGTKSLIEVVRMPQHEWKVLGLKGRWAWATMLTISVVTVIGAFIIGQIWCIYRDAKRLARPDRTPG